MEHATNINRAAVGVSATLEFIEAYIELKFVNPDLEHPYKIQTQADSVGFHHFFQRTCYGKILLLHKILEFQGIYMDQLKML